MIYQIRIKGHLGQQWSGWFEGLAIDPQENGDTLLTGPVVDQAALHGILERVRDLGMPLLSVTIVDADAPNDVDASFDAGASNDASASGSGDAPTES